MLILGAAVVALSMTIETAIAGGPDPDGDPAEPDEGVLALPTPKDFVSSLDLECFATPGPALNINLNLSHLNPVLVAAGLPAHNVIIRELQQTCVPVMKNNVPPVPSAAPFVRHVDLACYRIEAAPLTPPFTLNLRHLNPVLQTLPPHNVTLLQPEQLCLPVGKNGVVPPLDVFNVARYIDLECWRVEPQAHPSFSVLVTQLNGQLGGIPNHTLTAFSQPRQLCLPVRKNNQVIPPATLNIVRWIDLEKFPASFTVPATPVTLDHWNPFFTTLPHPPVVLQFTKGLMVPVAKNNVFPP